MKEVATILLATILIGMGFIAFGQLQADSAGIYGIDYDESQADFSNTTAMLIDTSEDLRDDLEVLQTDESTRTQKVEAFLGSTLESGRIVLKTPLILITAIEETTESTAFIGLGWISGLLIAALVIFIIFSLLQWRRAG